MSSWYDRQGRPLEMTEWCRLREDNEYKRVALDELPDGRRVSTVWLGLDHGHGGPPLIFETMVFPECDDCQRYATLEQAQAGHVEKVRELVEAKP